MLMMAILPASAQRLTVEKTVVDCGRTAYYQPVTAVFELRNRGLRKLRIDTVETACGCTGAEYPRGDISMGERFKVKVTYDARQLGRFQKLIGIFSNGSKKPVYLTMKGVVMAELKDDAAAYPYELGDLRVDKNNLEFDDVNRGDTPEQVIRVMNAGQTVCYPNLLHLPPYLTAVVTPERLSPNRSGSITVRFNSKALHDFGLTQTSVYLAKELGEKVSSQNEITVSTVLLPSFSGIAGAQEFAPKMLLSVDSLVVNFDGKKKRSGEIVITNEGRTALKITSLQMFTSGLRVTLGKRELQPGESTKLKVTAFMEELKKARSKPRVLMITNDPGRPKVVINIQAQ